MDIQAGNERCGPTLGVVLAGGKSLRMGEDKASLLHPVSRTSFLARALSLLRPVCESLAVSVVKEAKRQGDGLPADARLVCDRLPCCGPLGGIHASLLLAKDLACPRVLVLPCDLPCMEPIIVEALAKEPVGENGHIACFSALPGGLVEPLVSLWSVKALPFVEAALESGRFSVQKALPSRCTRLLSFGERDAELFANVNTKGDWERVLGKKRGSPLENGKQTSQTA